MRAVDDEYFSSLLDETEDRGSGCSAGAEDKYARAIELHAALERANNAGHIGIEAVELAVSAGAQCVACADAVGERVHVGKVRQDFLLERHGDGDTVEGQIADDGEQIIERFDFER